MSPPVHRVPVLCLLALSGWALCGPAHTATLYKWVDAQGVVHYSDTPHEGAEKIQVSGAQTFHSEPVPATPPEQAQTPGSRQKDRYVSCTIAEPAEDAGLYAPETVEVVVQTQPALQAGDTISAAMDGQSLGSLGGGSTSFRINQPERGQHTITAQVLGADGTVRCTAPPVSFSVQRPSLDYPQTTIKPH